MGYYSVENPIILNLDDDAGVNSYPDFIYKMRNTGWPVYTMLYNPTSGGFSLHFMHRSAKIGEVYDENYVFPVRLMYQEIEFDVLLQWYKLYLVGYKVNNGVWILLDGENLDKVSLGVKKLCKPGEGEPNLVPLGTSYSSLLKNHLGTKFKDEIEELYKLELKLNRQALIDAILYLKDASLGKVFDKKKSALHLIILIFVICESVRIKPISRHISNYYLSGNNTPPLTYKMLIYTHSWTRASRTIRSNSFDVDYEIFYFYGEELHKKLLEEIDKESRRLLSEELREEYTVEKLLDIFPYLKAVTYDEMTTE